MRNRERDRKRKSERHRKRKRFFCVLIMIYQYVIAEGTASGTCKRKVRMRDSVSEREIEKNCSFCDA